MKTAGVGCPLSLPVCMDVLSRSSQCWMLPPLLQRCTRTVLIVMTNGQRQNRRKTRGGLLKMALKMKVKVKMKMPLSHRRMSPDVVKSEMSRAQGRTSRGARRASAAAPVVWELIG